jgi:hypothetical protein
MAVKKYVAAAELYTTTGVRTSKTNACDWLRAKRL